MRRSALPARAALALVLLGASALSAGCLAAETLDVAAPCPEGEVPAPVPARQSGSGGAASAADVECLPFAAECVEDVSGPMERSFVCATTVSAGEAELRYDLMGTGSALVTVRDGAGEIVRRDALSMPTTGTLSLTGEPGFWSLSVDYYDAHGWARIVLSS